MQAVCLALGLGDVKMAEFGSGQVKAQAKGVEVMMRRTLVFAQTVIVINWRIES